MICFPFIAGLVALLLTGCGKDAPWATSAKGGSNTSPEESGGTRPTSVQPTGAETAGAPMAAGTPLGGPLSPQGAAANGAGNHAAVGQGARDGRGHDVGVAIGEGDGSRTAVRIRDPAAGGDAAALRGGAAPTPDCGAEPEMAPASLIGGGDNPSWTPDASQVRNQPAHCGGS